MGNEENESSLRKVNIQEGPISAVSESINATGFELGDIQSQNPNITVSSPVMKRLTHLQGKPAQAPQDQDLKTAFNEAGLKISSSSHKRKKMLAHSADLYAKQGQLQRLKGAAYVKPNVAIGFDVLRSIDPSEFMYSQEKGSPYDKYLSHYAQLQELFLYLPDMQATIDAKVSTLGNNPSPADKQAVEEATANLKTLYDIRTYYKTQEALMSNKYFCHLPQEEVDKLSYRDLRVRLDKLYSASQRNEDLIDYYQNQIRLREVALSGEKSAKDRRAEYLKSLKGPDVKQDTRKPEDVNKQIAASYEKLQKKSADKKSLIYVNAYNDVFFKCHAADLEKFLIPAQNLSALEQKLKTDYLAYKAARLQAHPQTVDETQAILKNNKPAGEAIVETGDIPPAGITLTKGQTDAVQTVSTYFLQHTDGHDAFVYRLVQMPPDLQLLTYYIIEKGSDESVVRADYLSALSNYQPDFETISQKKRDWNVISGAVRTSMKLSDEIKFYGALTQQAEATEALREDPNALLTDDEMAQSLSVSIIQHGKLLKMLYRSAGLHDDMPPDMAQDPVLRKKIFEEYNKIIALVGRLASLDLSNGAEDITDNSYSDPSIHGKQTVTEKNSSSLPSQKVAQKSISDTNQYVAGYTYTGIKSLAGSFMSAIPGNAASAASFVTSNSFGGATAIFGLVAAISNSVSIAQSYGTITTADRWAKAIGNTGEYTKVLAGGLSVSGSFTNLVQNGLAASTDWLKPASDALWNSTSVGSQLMMAGGITAMVAGGAKMVASGIQYTRGLSNSSDISAARATINAKLNAHQALSPEEQKLQRFLSHRQRSVHREEASAIMGMVSGAMSVVAGGFAMSGYLAPIGAIVGATAITIDLIYKGIDYGVKKKNQKKAVDEFLNTDELVNRVKGAANHPLASKIEDMSASLLKEKIREEALAMLGYTEYEQCFKDICDDMANLLYFKVFEENPPDPHIADYQNAISSLGFKVKKAIVAGDEHKPSKEAIRTKLMS